MPPAEPTHDPDRAPAAEDAGSANRADPAEVEGPGEIEGPPAAASPEPATAARSILGRPPTKHRSAARNWAEYLAIRGVAGLTQIVDVRQNVSTADALGNLYGRLSAKRRRRAEDNIARCFPEMTPGEVRATAFESMRHMLRLFMVDSLAMPRLVTPAAWPDHVRIGDLGPAAEHLYRGDPMLLLTGHCGNWELLGYYLSLIGLPVWAIARPLDNPLLDRWLRSIREARGMRIITKWGATPILQEVIRRGGRIGFIADQNAGDQGLFVPFFGRMASTYKSIALLAMRYEIPILCGGAFRVGDDFTYEVTATDYIRPSEWKDRPDPLFYITARYSRSMEAMIRRAPAQYLWVHRRWKSRPRWERMGNPMPERVVEKLRALPWMTEEELQRLRDDADRSAAAHRAAG